MGSEDARNSPEYGALRSMIRYMAVETAMAPTATATKDMGLCFDNRPIRKIETPPNSRR